MPIFFGLIFAFFSALFSFLWLRDSLLSISVSIASLLTIITAPLVALLVAQALQLAHKDPAAGTGPIATVIQDTLSIVIYGIVTSIIIL